MSEAKHKPDLGFIDNWRKVSCSEGYLYYGTFRDHPRFKGKWGHTSLVIHEEGNRIETLNSIYHLGKHHE